MADIDSAAVLADLSERLRRELAERKLKRLDAVRIRSQDRDLTRAASRLLHDDGHAGIEFRSRLDKVACHALFEGRARLERSGEPIPLSRRFPELLSVCAEYSLKLN